MRVVVLDPLRPRSRAGSSGGARLSTKLDLLTPTALVAGAPRRPIEIVPVPSRRWWRGAWCLSQIIGFFIKRSIAKVSKRWDEEEEARAARHLFERLSGMWIKLGQLLSLRNDILTLAMCRELASLQFEMRGFPSAVAMAVLEADLGVPIDTVFSYIDPKPFAAASICQVHRANLRDSGRAVIIKIRRPDVALAFEGDLRLLRGLARVLSAFGLGARLNVKDAITELSALLREEADYTNELMNLRQMRKKLKGHGVVVPRCYPQFCGPRILVMDEIPGVLMSDYIRQRRENSSAVREWEQQNRVRPERVARSLLITTLRQILEENQFHGDLHPGNIILLTDSRIALIDFGSVGRLTTRAWTTYQEMNRSIAMGEYERAADFMLLLGKSVPALGVSELRLGLANIFRKWEARSQLKTLPYSKRSLNSTSVETAELMGAYKMPASWELLRVGRALGTLDASLQVLAPDGDFLRLYKAYFRNRRKREQSREGRKAALGHAMQQLTAMGGDLKILLAPGIRRLALLERGMADTGTRVKIAVLTALMEGFFGLTALTVLSMIIDKTAPFIKAHFPGKIVLFIINVGPKLPYVDYGIIVLACLFASYVTGAARRSLIYR
jgi:ubiquinone biosynthesis protein